MSSRFNSPLLGVLTLIIAGYAHASLEQAEQALAEGNYSRARTELERVADGGQESIRWQLLDAAALAGSGELETAESRYKHLIDRSPNTPEAYNNLAVLYARQGRYEEARGLLERAMKTSDSYATVYENLSNIYFEMSRNAYAKALQMEQGERSASLQPLYAIDSGQVPMAVAAAHPAQTAEEKQPQQVAMAAEPPLPPAMPEPEAERTAEASTAEAQASFEGNVDAGNEETVAVALEPAARGMPEATPVVEEAGESQSTADAEMVVTVPAEPAVLDEPAAAAEMSAEETPAAVIQAQTATPRESLIATLERWAADWAGQKVEGYLDAYDETFEPGRGLSLEQWQTQRRRRLARPDYIEVQLSDFQVVLQDGERARVTLVQRYRSNTYRDRTRKRFRLIHRPEGWKIVSEKTIEVL